MTVTCFIRYRIDPFRREACKRYAEAQPQCSILREERSWLDDVSAERNVARQVTP